MKYKNETSETTIGHEIEKTRYSQTMESDTTLKNKRKYYT